MSKEFDDIEISEDGEISEEDLVKAIQLIREMKAAKREKMLSSGVEVYTLTKAEYLKQRIESCRNSSPQVDRLALKVEVLSELYSKGYSKEQAWATYRDLYT